MKLLTQEEGAALKKGTLVNIYWFKPRKPKGDPVPSRFFDGREEWVEVVWRNHEVSKDAWRSTQDGYAVKLKGSNGMFLTRDMELA